MCVTDLFVVAFAFAIVPAAYAIVVLRYQVWGELMIESIVFYE